MSFPFLCLEKRVRRYQEYGKPFRSIELPNLPLVFLQLDCTQWLALRALLHATLHVLDLVCACRPQLKSCKLQDADQKIIKNRVVRLGRCWNM